MRRSVTRRGSLLLTLAACLALVAATGVASADGGSAKYPTQYYAEFPLYQLTTTKLNGESYLTTKIDTLPLSGAYIAARWGRPIIYLGPFSQEDKWAAFAYHVNKRLEVGALFDIRGMWGKADEPPPKYSVGGWFWIFSSAGKFQFESGLQGYHTFQGDGGVRTDIYATQMVFYPLTDKLLFFVRLDLGVGINARVGSGDSPGDIYANITPAGIRMYWGAN